MAATLYDPSELTARDRVRGLIADTAATLRFQDEKIARTLVKMGFSGDPDAASDEQELPELAAAIYLLEFSQSSTADSQTVRLGDQSVTLNGGITNYESILANLRHRYEVLHGAEVGVGVGIAVEECYFEDLDPANGYR